MSSGGRPQNGELCEIWTLIGAPAGSESPGPTLRRARPLGEHANGWQGIKTGDDSRWKVGFWELHHQGPLDSMPGLRHGWQLNAERTSVCRIQPAGEISSPLQGRRGLGAERDSQQMGNPVTLCVALLG